MNKRAGRHRACERVEGETKEGKENPNSVFYAGGQLVCLKMY